MRLKPLVVSLIAVGLVLPAVVTAHPAPIDRRQAHQRARIAAGVRSGALTPRETTRLLVRQRAIAREERAYRRNGLQPWERADLQRDLTRASRAIARQAHDGQRR